MRNLVARQRERATDAPGDAGVSSEFPPRTRGHLGRIRGLACPSRDVRPPLARLLDVPRLLLVLVVAAVVAAVEELEDRCEL